MKNESGKVIKKNDQFVVKIESLGLKGEGVCHVNGQVVFVQFALPGEEVLIQIVNTKTKIAIGKVVKFLSKSEHRVEPACPYFGKCGGCDLMHMDYPYQLEFKREQVQKNLKNIGHIDVNVDACQESRPLFYRNKMSLPISGESGETKIGFYRENSHDLIEIDDCLITDKFCKNVIKIIKKYIKTQNISGFCEKTGSGLLKHIVARRLSDTLTLTLVTTSDKLPKLESLYNELVAVFGKVVLYVNINKLNNNVIFGKEFLLKFGKPVNEEICGLKVNVNPESFMQINNEIRDKIYAKVLDEIEAGAVVLDVYSGAGIMTGITSKKSSKSYGLEIVEAATRDADNLARENKIGNMININGDATKTLPSLVKKINNQKINIVLDPPRKGCTSEVLKAVADAKPDKIIYVSCNSATLSRDVALLLNMERKLKIKSVTPFDMFPGTRHCEVVCVIERVKDYG